MIQRIAKNADIKFCVSDDKKIQDKFRNSIYYQLIINTIRSKR